MLFWTCIAVFGSGCLIVIAAAVATWPREVIKMPDPNDLPSAIERLSKAAPIDHPRGDKNYRVVHADDLAVILRAFEGGPLTGQSLYELGPLSTKYSWKSLTALEQHHYNSLALNLNARSQADKAVLEDCVRFYAGEGCDNRGDFYVNRIITDKGTRARALLADLAKER